MANISLLQQIKESDFRHFSNLIGSLEERYKNITDDHLVDINNLEVVRTRSGRISKPRNTTSKKVTTCIKPSDGRSSSSTGSTSSSGFASSTGTSNTATTSSIMFDRSLQNKALKELLGILKSGDPVAELVSKRLIERSLLTLGRDKLPTFGNVRPFFTFHDSEEIGVTFLFDVSDLTPWTMICLKFFGQENVELYQQIYHIISRKETLKNGGKEVLQPRMLTSTPNVRQTGFAVESSQFNALTIRAQDHTWVTDSGIEDSDDLENLQTSRRRQSKNVALPCSEPSALSNRSSSSSSSQLFYSIKPWFHPDGFSMVYQNDIQRSSLQKLLGIIRANNEESRTVKKKLLERAYRALGMLPSLPASVRPFFTFHEHGEIGVSFLFDQSSLSPWSAICDLYFGKEILQICSEIYTLIAMPQDARLERLELLGQSYSSCSFDSGASKSSKPIAPRVTDRPLASNPPLSNRNSSGATTTTRKTTRLSLSPSVLNHQPTKASTVPALSKSRGGARAITTKSLARCSQRNSGVFLDLDDECTDDLAELAVSARGRKARRVSSIQI